MVIERKLKPGGVVREYPVELLHHDRALVIVRFHMTRGGEQLGGRVVIPAGSISDGYFWFRRPYNLYRMKHADGSLIAHRFDAVADVRFSDGVVQYRDLVLDWWALPSDEIVEEDRDELEALVREGAAGSALATAANAAARQVLGRYRHIIDEVTAFERLHALAT